ncbi:MAG: hypothetical protein MK106_09770 [Mariniblastus sp.]|nr:hypothetical protein [Mariniblastus sp.]
MPQEFIKLPCPECGKRLKLVAQTKRKKIVCPSCGHVFRMQPNGDSVIAGQLSGKSFEELSPAEVEAMRLGQNGSSKSDVSRPHSPDSSHTSSSYVRQEKAVQWVAQREQAHAVMLRRHRRVGVVLVGVAITAITAHFFGYRFQFLDGLALGLTGGGGVFYFVILGMLGAMLVGHAVRRSIPRSMTFASAAAILLVLGGVASFVSARWVDAKRSDRMLAGIASDSQQSVGKHDSDLHLKARLRRAEPRRVTPPDGSRLRRGQTTKAGNGFIEYPTISSGGSSLELSPIAGTTKTSAEMFRPADQAADISVSKIDEERKQNPFKAMNSAVFGATDTGSAEGEDFDLPEPELVRDLLNHPVKRAAMRDRESGLRPIRRIGGDITERARLGQYTLTSTAGRETKLGMIYFRDQPCIGLDALKSTPPDQAAFELILPIHGLPEFPNSLRHKKGYFLVGIKVNVQQGEVVGVQALLAPVKGSRLNVDRSVASKWAGQETAPEQFQVVAETGQAVCGIVVYEEKLKITGIGLVVKK